MLTYTAPTRYWAEHSDDIYIYIYILELFQSFRKNSNTSLSGDKFVFISLILF